MADDPLPPVAEKFIRYVQIDTQSDRSSQTTPSTAKQKDLGRLLVRELQEMGIADAAIDDNGYVYGNLAAVGAGDDTPAVALVAHVDTSPDEPGGPVKPLIHRNYDGSVITLPEGPSVKIDPARSPALLEHKGQDLITSDGTTLLGSDDKAGVAVIMQVAEDLLADGDHPRPTLRLCFTVDEEIGRGVDKLDMERLGADVAYTIDGCDVGDLDIATFNACEATIRVTGVNVHPGSAKGIMANAASILCRILAALPAAEAPETTEGEEGYFCPTEIEGNISRAEVKMLLRDFTDEGMERRKALVEQLVAAARLEHPRSTIEVEIVEQYKNMLNYIEETDPRAISFAFEAGRAMGLELRKMSVRGGTDGSRLSEEGLPTPNIFNGGHDFHSRFEWNTVQNLETTVTYVKQLVRYWAEHGGEPG